jgi:hypothetical protein
MPGTCAELSGGNAAGIDWLVTGSTLAATSPTACGMAGIGGAGVATVGKEGEGVLIPSAAATCRCAVLLV